MRFAAGIEMNQIGQQLFAGARLTLNQDRGLSVGDAKGQLNRAPNAGRLSDDAILAMPFMQRALQAHDLGGKMIALQSRAYLIGDALDQRDLVIFEPIALFAPYQTQQPKSMARD